VQLLALLERLALVSRAVCETEFELKYHLILLHEVPEKILRDRLAERARDLISQICAAREVVIVRGAVSSDHVHPLLSAPPIWAQAELAQYITGRSSRHLQAEFAELRNRQWVRHMWARGYSAQRWTRQRLKPGLKPKVGRR
jgi:putative transposase